MNFIGGVHVFTYCHYLLQIRFTSIGFKFSGKIMITSIEIENFRCFDYTKIEGFSRVNLIGGKNNSGKTALLEAILLNQSPRFETIKLLQTIRDESEELQLKNHQDTWNYLFFKENIKDHSILRSITQELEVIEIKLSVKEEMRNVREDTKNRLTWKYRTLTNFDHYGLPPDQIISVSMLTILKTITSNSQVIDLHNLYLYQNNHGLFYKYNDQNVPIPEYISPRLIISYQEFRRSVSSHGLAQQYQIMQKTYQYHNQEKILNILKIFDPSLEKIELIDHEILNGLMLYLKRENENSLPLAYFGDAMSRVLRIALNLINNQSHYLMIDEIENGIHYTNHRDFWKALFELAKQLNIQIFATTHSLEMIQAFTDVGLNYYPEDGAYFEMTRHYDTDQIIGIKRDLDTLDYALKHGKGVRGE
jgi:AAA15 family ATPase/GTPase